MCFTFSEITYTLVCLLMVAIVYLIYIMFSRFLTYLLYIQNGRPVNVTWLAAMCLQDTWQGKSTEHN